MSDIIRTTFSEIRRLVATQNDVNSLAQQVIALVQNMRTFLQPPLSLDFSSKFIDNAFQATKDIIQSVRRSTSIDCDIKQIIQLPVAVFANLMQKYPHVVFEVIVAMNHALSDNILSSFHVEAHVYCMAMLLQTMQRDRERIKELCTSILIPFAPIFDHLLGCGEFSTIDHSILQGIFTIFMTCMKLNGVSKATTLEWLANLEKFNEKACIADLRQRVDACFFTAFHYRTFLKGHVLSYYKKNLARFLTYARANVNNFAHAEPITSMLVFIYTYYPRFKHVTESQIGPLLSLLLTILRVNAHCLLEGTHAEPYNQQAIMKFLRNLLIDYPKMRKTFTVCVDKPFNHSEASLASIVASMDALSCYSNFLLSDEDRSYGKYLTDSLFLFRLPKLALHSSSVVQRSALRVAASFSCVFKQINGVSDFVQCIVIDRLLNDPTLNEQLYDDIAALLVHPSCRLIVKENAIDILLKMIRHGGEHTDRFFDKFYSLFAPIQSDVSLLVDCALQLFDNSELVESLRFLRFVEAIVKLAGKLKTMEADCIQQFHVFTAELLKHAFSFREYLSQLLVTLIRIEAKPSITTTRLTAQYIHGADETNFQSVFELLQFYHHCRPNSKVVFDAMFDLVFSQRFTNTRNRARFLCWMLPLQHVDFPVKHTLGLLAFFKSTKRPYALAMFGARLMLSSKKFIESLTVAIDLHWSREEFFKTWLNAVLNQVQSGVDCPVHSALRNALDYFGEDKGIRRRLQTTLEYFQEIQ